MIPSYPKILHIGDPRIKEIFDGPVLVQEKIDGSQISFGLLETGPGEWTLQVRSKGAPLDLESHDRLFKPSVAAIREAADLMEPGYIYRGEALCAPRHNTLQYDRAPEGNVVLFDVQTPAGMLPASEVIAIAREMGFEPCPSEVKHITSPDDLKHQLTKVSCLGGVEVEGVVVKNYNKPNPMPYTYGPMMGKYVRESFKELHTKEWRKAHPTRNDVVVKIIDSFNPPVIWEKGVIRQREKGELNGNPTDIGPLLRDIGTDLKVEAEEVVKELLFKHFWPQIQRGVLKGLPEWYKERLMKEQFEQE